MDLKVIENDLVPVYETDQGEKVVYGTELHDVLEVKTAYKDWSVRRFNECDAIENTDFEAAQICAPSGQTRKEHIIKLDTAKEMAMLERNDKGKQVRRYFIQVEKKYKSAVQPAGGDLQIQLEAFQKFIRMQTEFMERQETFNRRITEKINSIGRLPAERGFTNSMRIETELTVRERKTCLYELAQENAELRDISANSFLHVLYSEIEREFDVSLNAYRSVYCSEMEKSAVGMLEVVAANDRFYRLAVEICEFMIKDFKQQAELSEQMKKSGSP